MDQATLVGPDVNAASEALVKLDEANINPQVALLALFPEYGDWRFVLSSPKLDKIPLRKAHLEVAEVMRHFAYTMPPNMIFAENDPFIRALKKTFGKAANVQGMRLGGQTIGDRYLEAGYVFRVK